MTLSDAGSSAVYIDTSIQILRFIGSPRTKERVLQRLSSFELVVTGLIVRQEFKRRFLKEAKYLIEQLDRRDSLSELLHHLSQGLGPIHARRKAPICQGIVAAFMGKRVFGIQSADEEMDRFRAYLEMLLEGGLDEFDSMVDHVIQDSGCSAGSVAIRRVGSRYDFGHDKCSRHSDCRIRAMLERKADTVAVLAAALSEIPEGSRTAEIQLSLQFLAKVTADTSCSKDCDPCLKGN